MKLQDGARRASRSPALRARTDERNRIKGIAELTQWLSRYRGHTHTAYKRESARFIEFLSESGVQDGLFGATPTVFEQYARSRPTQKLGSYGLQVLRSLYASLCEQGLLETNPVPLIKGTARIKSDALHKHFTRTELTMIGEVIDALVSEPGGHRRSYATRRWIFWLLAYTGAQREEIAASSRRPALKMSDLHCFKMDEGASVTPGWVLDVTDSAGSLRHIRLSPPLIVELVKYRQSLALNWHPRPADETPLIVGNGWKPMGAQGIYTNVQAMFAAVARYLRANKREPRLVARLEEATPIWLTRSFHALSTAEFEC
jgi:integrase